jgi:hypothetical protein
MPSCQQALQARRNTDYGSFFEYTARPTGYPDFCILHGSGHSVSSCSKLGKLYKKWALHWDSSEHPALRTELWALSICNPDSLQRQCAARSKQREARDQFLQGRPQGAALDPVTPGKRAGVSLGESFAKRQQYTAVAAMPAVPAFASGLIPQQHQQQQVPFNSSSTPVAVAASAASAPAPVAADSQLLSYLVKHSSEEGKRANEKLEKKMIMLLDVQAQHSTHCTACPAG